MIILGYRRAIAANVEEKIKFSTQRVLDALLCAVVDYWFC